MGPGRFPLARFARKRRRDDEMGRRAIRRHLLVQHVDRSERINRKARWNFSTRYGSAIFRRLTPH
jgi:hypothetical protein